MSKSKSKVCRCCKNSQSIAGEDHRELYEVPKSHLGDAFKKKGSVYLCEYCDGDAYEMVLQKEEKDRS